MGSPSSISKITSGSQLSIGGGVKTARADNIAETLKFTEKYLVPGTSYLSLVMGGLSFILHNLVKKPSEILDKIGTLSAKAAFFVTAVFGGITKIRDMDTSGSLAYTMDTLTPFIASGEELYQWKGWGSATDHFPLMLTELAYHPQIKKEYDLTDGHEGIFNQYKNFWDSAKKACYGVKIILGDIFREFKENKSKGLLQAILHPFVRGERTAEKNLLVSSFGIYIGTFLGTILGFKKTGSTIRDLFGIHADFAYINKGASKVSGKGDSGKKEFLSSGIFYTIGSVLDLIYRWTGLEGLNLLAIGFDRLGNCDAVKGITRDVEAARNNTNSNPQAT